jgi:hypothetical protein
VLTELDVEWQPVLLDESDPDSLVLLEGGTDTTFSWSIRRQIHSGDSVDVEVTPCGGTAPDLCNPVLREAYGQYIPDSVYELPLPATAGSYTVSSPVPGGAVEGNLESALVGLDVSDPFGAWPPAHDSPDITWLDPDEDGNDGVTSLVRGSGYSSACRYYYAYLPIPTGSIVPPRAREIYLGSRALGAVDGSIISCDEVRGTVLGAMGDKPLFNGRISGCETTAGSECSSSETDALDAEAGTSAQEIIDSRFVMVRVADDVTCSDVRAMEFP